MAKSATKSTGPKGVNWPDLRTQYVASDRLTLRELAEEHGLVLSVVGQRSSAEGWPKLRLERQEQDADKTLTKLRLKHQAELAERIEEHLLGLRMTQRRLLDQIAYGKRTGRTVKDAESGEDVDEREPLNAASMDKAAGAYAASVKAERLTLGEVTQRTETTQSDEDRKRAVREVVELLRSEGDPEELADQLRHMRLRLLGEEDAA